MGKTIILLAVFVLGLLTSLLVGVQTVKAQHTPDGQGFPLVSPISVTSPSNSTYSSSLLTLNITIQSLLYPSSTNITMVYSVNGKDNATIPIVAGEPNPNEYPISPIIPITITGWVALPELPEGPHNITVYAKYQLAGTYHNIGLDSSTVYFTINDGNPPIISNLSLENKTYNQNDLSLNFTMDESTSWVGYCLDGKANRTVSGNTTLTGLSDGPHSVVVYANDTAGNIGASETVFFSIDTSEPLPTAQVATASVSVAVISVGLLVYFKKRNYARINKHSEIEQSSA